jgi:hypothetical protein
MIIQIKHTANTGNVPLALANGELALNTADEKLYYKHANGSIILLANGQSLGISTDEYARMVANAAFAQANAAYDTANNAWTTANLAFLTAVAAYAEANVAYSTANAAYAKANGSVQTAFTTINVAGQNTVVSTSNTDTLSLVAGESILITTDAPNNSITLAVTTLDGGTF